METKCFIFVSARGRTQVWAIMSVIICVIGLPALCNELFALLGCPIFKGQAAHYLTFKNGAVNFSRKSVTNYQSTLPIILQKRGLLHLWKWADMLPLNVQSPTNLCYKTSQKNDLISYSDLGLLYFPRFFSISARMAPGLDCSSFLPDPYQIIFLPCDNVRVSVQRAERY